ncbi:MAG: S9 family peptidase [Planctomycetota bacterium]|nr:MAG: S9 family peptidase [Planctomycetota bacterium]
MRRAYLLALLALAPACATVQRGGEPLGVPTLAQIFGGAELLDKRPQLLAIAPDGSSVVVRWSPGIATYAHEDGALRLIETSGPRAGERCGVELAELLPPPPRPETAPQSAPESQPSRDEREPSAWTYDVRGGQLFVARGTGLWRIDPCSRQRDELLPERRRSAAESANALAGTLGEIERLEAREAVAGLLDRPTDLASRDNLFVYDGEDLFLVSAELAQARRPLERSDLVWWNESLAPKASALRWSRDLAVAFSPDAAIVRAAPPAESQPESAPTHEPRPQIWLHAERRAVELLDYDSLENREHERLSPDGRWVFAMTRDKSHLKGPIPVPDYLTARVSTRDGRRETAEDGPQAVRMYRWDTATGERREIALAEPFDAGWYGIVDWTPQGDQLIVRWSSPDWTEQRYLAIDRDGWSERGPLRNSCAGWVGGPANQLVWDAAPQPSIFSNGASHWPIWYAGVERGDRASLEWSLSTPTPAFAGELDRLQPLRAGGLLVESAASDPGRHELFVLEHDFDKLDARRLRQPDGFNTDARANSDGSVVAFVHESSGVPAEIWASDADGARPLTSTAPEAFTRVQWLRPGRRSFTSADGTTVWANVWLPQRRDAPCVVFVHGAGYLQNVTDSLTEYPLNWMFHARLARLGYAVVDVDYRGSKGYGRAFRTAIKDRLGEKELADIHAALDALAHERALDRERVALYGGSYGGFLTLMALFTEPGRWRAGAALRSVADWRSYHPTYTQPRLGKPSSNPDAYAQSSPIDHVEGLRDPLLLLHGLRDDNVFAQDTLRVVEQLVLHGKSFELMLYPSQGHTYDSGPHWLDQYQRIEAFLRRHLDARVERAPASR